MKLDRAGCVFAEDYSDFINRVSLGERFVLMFTLPLVVDETKHQVRIYIGDLLTARAVLTDGQSIPLCYLMDMVGQDFSMTTDGADMVDFAGWAVGAFEGQFVGIYETPLFREPDQKKISWMINLVDSPSLWLFEYLGLFSSLLIYDESEWEYRVVNTWIKGIDDFVPLTLDEAVASLPKKLQFLIGKYLQSEGTPRTRLLEEIKRQV